MICLADVFINNLDIFCIFQCNCVIVYTVSRHIWGGRNSDFYLPVDLPSLLPSPWR